MKAKVYDMKVLTDNDCEFETSNFTTTINKIVEIVDNMKEDKLVYINVQNNMEVYGNEDVHSWVLIHTDGLHEEVLSLCYIDEETPTTMGDKLHMCHMLFTLLSSGNYGLDNSYFEKEE